MDCSATADKSSGLFAVFFGGFDVGFCLLLCVCVHALHVRVCASVCLHEARHQPATPTLRNTPVGSERLKVSKEEGRSLVPCGGELATPLRQLTLK